MTGLGVERQRRDCAELVERLGWTLVETYEDNDRSAYSGKPRPGYEAMTERLRRGDIGAVVAWHPDRLTRQPRELEDLIDVLEATKTTVRTVQTGEYDLSTASGRMVARVIGAMARHESEHKSDRLRRKHLELAEAGRPPGGGKRPYGYTSDRAIVPTEAAIIRECVDRLLAGSTLSSLVRDLNDRKVPTVSGSAPWSVTTLKAVLTSALIAGHREHRGHLYRAAWPGIISIDEMYAMRAVLNRRRGQRPARSYLLSAGIAVCGACGAKMAAKPTGAVRRYSCVTSPHYGGCGRVSIDAAKAEGYVVGRVLDHLESDKIAAAVREMEAAPVDASAGAELEVLNGRLAQLGEMWAAGEIDTVSWRAARDRLELEIASAESRLVRQPTMPAVGATVVRDEWDSMEFDTRRAILAEVVERVIVAPHIKGRPPRFDPDRLRIVPLDD